MNNHLIKPPIDLIKQWSNSLTPGGSDILFANQAARWGAGQAMEACDDYVSEHTDWPTGYLTRVVCGPKPPSLKELALEAIDNIERYRLFYIEESIKTVRTALEALPND